LLGDILVTTKAFADQAIAFMPIDSLRRYEGDCTHLDVILIWEPTSSFDG
jgi:hypothetical protein